MFTFSDYDYDFKNSVFNVSGESMLFHCHHYNTYLQRSIQDAEYIDSKPFLVGAASECAYGQIKRLTRGKSLLEGKNIAQELYRLSGFGTINLTYLSDTGGEIRTTSSHYSMGWKEKFGKSNAPVALFSAGYLAGAYAALFNKELKHVHAEQTTCISMGDPQDTFIIREGDTNFSVYEEKRPAQFVAVENFPEPETNVDKAAITQAITGMPLLGNDEGIIPAFGVYLTRMYADYYNRISFEFEKEMIKAAGPNGIEISSSLFIEAGHVCAFNTFGGIMTSSEWDSLILPQIKTREDWVHSMIAVVNALGWGVWKVVQLSESSAIFRVYNDYESIGYARMYGEADHGISYLVTGAAAGIMDLIYFGDVMSKPEFNAEFYTRLFKGPDAYKFELKQSQAQGKPCTEVIVYK